MFRPIIHTCFIICLLGATILVSSPARAQGLESSVGNNARIIALTADVADIKRNLLALDHEPGLPAQVGSVMTTDRADGLTPRQSRLRLARSFIANGLYPEAINEIRFLPAPGAADADSREVSLVLAEALARQGEFVQAEDQLWRLCNKSRQSCNDGRALFLLTGILIDQKRGDEARRLVRNSLALSDPGDVVKLDIAMLFNRAAMPDAVLEVLAGNVLDMAKLASAQIMIDRDDREAAKKVLSDIKSDGLYGDDARFKLGWLAFTEDHYDQAWQYWSRMNLDGLVPVEFLSVRIVAPYARWQIGDKRLAITGYRSAIDFYQSESKAIRLAQSLLNSKQADTDVLAIDADMVRVNLPAASANQVPGSRNTLLIRTDSDSRQLWRLNEDLSEMAAMLEDYRNAAVTANAGNLQQRIADISRHITATETAVSTELRSILTRRLQARAVVVSSCLEQARYMVARLLDQYNSEPNHGS